MEFVQTEDKGTPMHVQLCVVTGKVTKCTEKLTSKDGR